jgi:hypothetical protein
LKTYPLQAVFVTEWDKTLILVFWFTAPHSGMMYISLPDCKSS